MEKYKIITRSYYDENGKLQTNGKFICQGIWGDGHLAYTRLDENGNDIEDEKGAYFQCKGIFNNKTKLYMEHI